MSSFASPLAYLFGSLCILSAPPFLGYSFPNARAALYYAKKNEWVSSLSGDRMSPVQAGYFGAGLRIFMGLGVISTRYRSPTLLLTGSVIGLGTFAAVRDGKPLLPQFGMVGAIGALLVLGRL